MKKIKLTQGKFALVDDEDYGWLSQFKWTALKVHRREVYYAVGSKKINGKWVNIRMHKEIMNPPEGMDVDHRDRDGLNNQRYNLRICTRSQNSHNRGANKGGTSKYKGVCYCSKYKKWRTSIMTNGSRKLLGYFKTELEAAIMVNYAIRKYHGEYAKTNKLTKISY